MANEFKCPSCSAPMEFSGGDSIFQTCKKCHAPIVIPSEIFYTKEQQIDAEDFATLANDKPVTEKQVSLDVGAGDVAGDDKIEEIIKNPQNNEFASENVGSATSQNVQTAGNKQPSEAQLGQLNYLINQGRKIEAIRFYRGIYGSDLETAKTKVEEMSEKHTTEMKNNNAATYSDVGTQTVVENIKKEIAGGNKINAIKIFMDSFDAGLKESKEIVDAMESGRKVDISGFQRR